ncbi:glycoside hydrolase family 28 protein [Paenibacillus vietnamensis]|uniref:glycoside hydrolase family 28 protein n=1 Tax=Paenibacillus vietnamensis TaxID=2590547 RepID=UPI001CD151CC|nr:glycosyl hydrolase family 28 protein [Paenibacillus vietnamensis]
MNRTGAFGLGPQTQQTPETPIFPEKQYSIVDFGAIGDGFTMNTEGVNLAIETCSSEGGGTVHIPPGNPWYSQNGAGLDLDSCRYVEVSDSQFDVGDDAICIKSGKDADGRDLGVPCQDISIRGCVVYHEHGGFVIGSEMSGGVRNVSISDCLFIGTDLGLRFKSARGRGGVVEKIRIRNIRMTGIPKAAITFSMFYSHGGSDQPAAEQVSEKSPIFRDFLIEHVRHRDSRHCGRNVRSGLRSGNGRIANSNNSGRSSGQQ